MRRLSVSMTRREAASGFCYLTAELFLLPSVLNAVNGLLGNSLSAARLNALYFGLNFFCVLALFHRFLKQSIVAAKARFPAFLGVSGLGFAVYWGISLGLSVLFQRLEPGFVNANDSAIMTMAGEDFWVVAVGTVALVPTAEEVLYRGLIFGRLYRRNPAAAYFLSSAVFSAVHVTGYLGAYPPVTLLLCFAQYLPAGLCLGWAYTAADTICAPILIHTIINALGIFAMR